MSFRSFLHRYEKPVMVLAASAGVTAVLLSIRFNLLEANLYDLRMMASVSNRADPDIALVALDDRTLKRLDQLSPLTLDYHARLMEALEKVQPRAVGYLIDFNQVRQANPDLFPGAFPKLSPNPAQDRRALTDQAPRGKWMARFMGAIERMEARGTPVILGTPFDVTGEVVPPYPLRRLQHDVAVIHKDGNVFSEDKVTRRALVTLNGRPSFHMALAHAIDSGLDRYPPGTFAVPEIDSRYFFFRYHGSTAQAPGERRGPYPMHSLIDILNGGSEAESLRGKIVLIGTLQRNSTHDFAYTPFSRTPMSNPKLLIHANILDSILHNDGIRRTPSWVAGAVTFAVGSFVFWWVLILTPLYGVFATITLLLLFLATGQLLFEFRGIWIRESQPIVGIFTTYYLAVPYRLIREYKKRWEYQRKNQILTQVEELKTNFLSLVTHDLKTPVARIQGLAEVLSRKSKGLAPSDHETLKHIISSTEELNRFITSILELSKVESQRLHLRVESRDINQLIERSLEGFGAQARARGIRITSRLEPLFPIRIDPSLISKVINNLIDNAIKYSTEGAEIRVESRETGPWVEIAVQDHGIGLSPEERESLFTRFYRAKNDRTRQIPGTGLGLYLTRYFIEAHGGRVEVESERGRGSRFTILLPVEGPGEDAIAEPAVEAGRPRGLTRRLRAIVGKKDIVAEKT